MPAAALAPSARRAFALAPLLLLAACVAPGARLPHATIAAGVAPVEVGLIAFNDFHGALEPPRQTVTLPGRGGARIEVPAGGAAWLASAVRAAQARHPYHLTLSAGDLTSASQFASAAYLDEPAVGVANRLGLDFNAVGNHEFDRGWRELQRLQHGGCAQLTAHAACALERFEGARFTYLAANVDGPDGHTIFPATGLRRFGQGARQVSVGVIGLTLRGTRDLVSPDGIAGITFADEAERINAGVVSLKAAGAQAVIVLIHQGIKTLGAPDPDGCAQPAGDLAPILARLDPRVDVVVSGHTHWAYVCEWPRGGGAAPLLLTSAGVYGKLVTEIALAIDPAGGRVVRRSAHNLVVQSEAYRGEAGAVALTDAVPRVAPAADVRAYVARYVAAAHAVAQRVIGRLSAPLTRPAEAALGMGGAAGHLIADAQLAATRGAGAEIAFTNPFGVRAALVPAADGSVRYGQAFVVQPFANRLVTLGLTGAEIKAAIEQGIDDDGPKQLLSPSAGFTYRYDLARAPGDRVRALALGGVPLDPARVYRVTVANFLAGGGDGFSVFRQGREPRLGGDDLAALVDWIGAVPVRAVPADLREGPA